MVTSSITLNFEMSRISFFILVVLNHFYTKFKLLLHSDMNINQGVHRRVAVARYRMICLVLNVHGIFEEWRIICGKTK